MQAVAFSPCALINGTWFVTEEDAALSPLLVGRYEGPSWTDSITSFLGFSSVSNNQKNTANPSAAADLRSEYEILEQEKIAKNVVAIDLASCVDFASDSTIMPASVLPLDIAPRHVQPLQIEEFSKTYSGGAKTLWWTGPCKSVLQRRQKQQRGKKTDQQQQQASEPIDSLCTLMVLRGHWALSVFPYTGEEAASILNKDENKNENQIPSPISVSGLEPYVVLGTRLDANEVLEEAVFNRKVRYVLVLMFVVAVIHYILTFFQPPTAKKIRKDQALAKLLALEKAKLAQVQQRNAALTAKKDQ
jgi:hypothetical protein